MGGAARVFGRASSGVPLTPVVELRSEAPGPKAIDTIGGDTLTRSLAILGEEGRLISVAPAGRDAHRQDPRARFFIVASSTEQLERLAALVESGDIRPHIHARYPLRRAVAAYQAAAAGGVRGKIVVHTSGDRSRTHMTASTPPSCR